MSSGSSLRPSTGGSIDSLEAGAAAVAGSAAPGGPLRGVPDTQALSAHIVLGCKEYLGRMRDV